MCVSYFMTKCCVISVSLAAGLAIYSCKNTFMSFCATLSTCQPVKTVLVQRDFMTCQPGAVPVQYLTLYFLSKSVILYWYYMLLRI
jgi:hypothetical protein